MRKLSLSLVALALVALFSVAANKPAHAYQLNGCTTEWVEGVQVTAKVVDPGNLSNTTVFTEGCQIGVLLTHGGQTVNNVTVIGDGYSTLADVAVTGSFTSYITNVNLTNAITGLFVDYSTTYVNHATITGTLIGIFGFTSNTGKLTLTNSNIFDNFVGVNYYESHVTASYNNIHENYIAGYLIFGGYGSSSHDHIWGNQGAGIVSALSFGGFTLAYDNIEQNGYGLGCSNLAPIDGPTLNCVGSSINVKYFSFNEQTNSGLLSLDGLYAGVAAYYSKVTLSHTYVRYNHTGVFADGFGTTVSVQNYSTVCVNHYGPYDSNFEASDSATLSVSSTSHVCLP